MNTSSAAAHKIPQAHPDGRILMRPISACSKYSVIVHYIYMLYYATNTYCYLLAGRRIYPLLISIHPPGQANELVLLCKLCFSLYCSILPCIALQNRSLRHVQWNRVTINGRQATFQNEMLLQPQNRRHNIKN